MLTAEVVSLVEQQGVELICIAALPPGTTTPTRYLCKRLRTRFPACKILVGHWGWTGESDTNWALLLSCGRGRCGGPVPPGEPQSGEAMGPHGLVPSSRAIADRGAGATPPRREPRTPVIVATHDSPRSRLWAPARQGHNDPARDSPAKLPDPHPRCQSWVAAHVHLIIRLLNISL